MYEISSYMKTFFGSMYEISSCYDRGFLIDEIMLYLIMYELFHDPYTSPPRAEWFGASPLLMSETLFKVQKRIQGVDWAWIMLQGKLENCPKHLKLLWLSKRSGVISLSGYLCINRGNFLHWLLTPVNITISRTCIFILFKYFRSHFKSNLLEWFWVSGWNFLLRPSFTIMHFCPHRFHQVFTHQC